jgi:hypothetical protein
MFDVEVVVLDAEEAENQVAEFSVDGTPFAFTTLLDETLVLEFLPRDHADAPTRVGALSLHTALERARELLS